MGDVAPDFALAGSDGQTYRLSELLADGRTKVALAWFPKAFTSGCTEELRSLRDSGKALAGFDVRTFMVSLDPPERNRAFAGSLDADLTLLSDPDGAVARRYGVLAPGGGYARRWTFYIDSSGVIERIDRDVKPASAGADLLSVFETLGW